MKHPSARIASPNTHTHTRLALYFSICFLKGRLNPRRRLPMQNCIGRRVFPTQTHTRSPFYLRAKTQKRSRPALLYLVFAGRSVPPNLLPALPLSGWIFRVRCRAPAGLEKVHDEGRSRRRRRQRLLREVQGSCKVAEGAQRRSSRARSLFTPLLLRLPGRRKEAAPKGWGACAPVCK